MVSDDALPVAIRRELDRVLHSRVFERAHRSQRLLHYLVDAALADPPVAPKEVALAFDVFDRDSTYDPAVDATVRVEASRLRSRLREYFDEEGRDDPWRIDLPKGAYAVTFTPAAAAPQSVPAARFAPLASSTTAAHDPLPNPRPWLRVSQMMVALALCVAVAAPLLHHRKLSAAGRAHFVPRPEYADLRVTPLTALPGSEVEPTFSPNGDRVAFAWDGREADSTHLYDLYIKRIGSEQLEQLTHQPAEWIVPAWSPDGKAIAFYRRGGGASAIFTVPAAGGPERKLVDVPMYDATRTSLSWSPDGQQLAFYNQYGMRTLTVADGAVHPIAEQPGCVVSLNATFSPDGRWIAFSCILDNSGYYDLYVMPAVGGPATRVIKVNDHHGPLAWSPDSERIVYTEYGQLFSVDRTGGLPQPLPFIQHATDPAISSRGKRLAYAETRNVINLWRLDLRPASMGATTLLAGSSSQQFSPDISPDGRRIAFASERSGRFEVWVSNLDGKEAVQLSNFTLLTGTPRWSPDGRWIAFDSREGGRSSLYLADPQGGPPRFLSTGDLAAQEPMWSRDGEWIYFTDARRAAGGIYRVRPEGGTPELVALGGFNVQQGRRGRSLLFTTELRNAPIHVLDPDTGEEHELEGMPSTHTAADWVVATRGIYYVDFLAKPATIGFYDFATRRVTRRLPLPGSPAPWGGLALAPDETWLAYAQVDRSDSDLMLAEPLR